MSSLRVLWQITPFIVFFKTEMATALVKEEVSVSEESAESEYAQYVVPHSRIDCSQ
jgi:hypothetical protein